MLKSSLLVQGHNLKLCTSMHLKKKEVWGGGLTIISVPEVINIPDSIDRQVINHTARGHVRVSFWVNVRVSFPRLTRPKF